MWNSYKREVDGVIVNALVTESHSYFTQWKIAADACRFIEMMGIQLPTNVVHGIHGVIMDGADPFNEARHRKLGRPIPATVPEIPYGLDPRP